MTAGVATLIGVAVLLLTVLVLTLIVRTARRLGATTETFTPLFPRSLLWIACIGIGILVALAMTLHLSGM